MGMSVCTLYVYFGRYNTKISLHEHKFVTITPSDENESQVLQTVIIASSLYT